MHFKQNNKESKTYVQGLRPFGNTLPRGVRGILKKNGYNYSEIVSKWNLLVGNDIAKLSYPKSIKMKKNSQNGVLILAIKRGDEISIEYSKKEIIDKINSYFGYKLINEIKLQVFNPSIKKNKINNLVGKFSKNFEKKINEIESKKIRNSLSELLKSINNINAEIKENELNMRKDMKQQAYDMLESAGFKNIKATESTYGFGIGIHEMGTARMGTDPKNSVVNEWGRSHDVDNLFIVDSSIFVTSSGVNPVSTMQALSLYIADSMKKNLTNLFE